MKNDKPNVIPITSNLIFKNNIITLFELDSSERRLVDLYLKHMNQVITDEGLKQAILVLKEEHRILSRAVLRQCHKIQQGPRWIAVNTFGIPKYFKMNRYQCIKFRKDDRFQRIMLTLMSAYKLLYDIPNYDISTITDDIKSDPKTFSEVVAEISSTVKEIKSSFRLEDFEINDKHSPIHVTTKAGAYGPKAMGVTSIFDLHSTSCDGTLTKILELIPLVHSTKNSKIVIDVIDKTTETIDTEIRENVRPSSRLHFIAEGGGKTRVICISNIWAQMALKPIHTYLMDLLTKFKCDGTSSHNNLAVKVKEYTKDSALFCYDLKAATDRMPILLQKEVLKPLLGEKIVDLWESVINSEVYVKHLDSKVKYKVGQPMGLLSSWAAMAYTHHIIVNYCYIKCGYVSVHNRKYALIGDDIVIQEHDVAALYKDVLTKLGMEIALAKSVIPNNRGKSAEIAKRIFMNGIEKSPVNAQLIQIATNSLQDLLALDRILLDRSYYNFSQAQKGQLSPSHKKSNESTLGFLNRDKLLLSFLLRIKKSEQVKAYIYMSSRLSKIHIEEASTIAGRISEHPISKVAKLVWGLDYGFNHNFERFLLETLTYKIVDFEKRIAAKKKLDYAEPKRAGYSETTPIIEKYYTISIDEMLVILNKYNTQYIDEEGDSDDLLDATDPNYIMDELFARPDPLDNSAFFKRRILSRWELQSSMLMSYLKKREGAVKYELLIKSIEAIVNIQS